MALRSEWLKTRQQLLAQIKRQVAHRLGPSARDLKLYIRRYNAEFSRPWRRSNQSELKLAVNEAQVVLGADFHAFSQSQRIHLRILREQNGRPVLLLLEALTPFDNVAIQRYLQGELTEAEFLEITHWQTRWGFPFSNYRPLFELARERGFTVAGLSPKTKAQMASLKVRDQFSSEVIAKWRKRYPQALVYVIVGDLHLAAGHLPNLLKSYGKVLTILQNSEHLYFRLAKTGQEHQIEVMRALGGRFCVLSSPPWVKWQSYLMYLEQTYDRDLEASEVDFTDYVASMAVFISQELGIESRLEELSVFTPQGSVVWRHVTKGLKKADRKLAEALIRNERSFLLPQSRIVFLARPSINHAATMAGQFLHNQVAKWTQVPWACPRHFQSQIWIEGWGYFFSKLINHKRKAEQIDDLKRQLVGSKSENRQILRLALMQRLLEISGRTQLRFRPKSRVVYLEAARRVGHMLGERIYLAYQDGKLPREEILEALKKNPLDKDFGQFYRRFLSSGGHD